MKVKVHILNTYRFTNKDPVIDKMRALANEQGVSDYHAALMAGLAPGTVKNWFEGDTRKPQFSSVIAFTRALGYEMNFKRARRIDVDAELKAAREFAAEVKEKSKAELERVREFSW